MSDLNDEFPDRLRKKSPILRLLMVVLLIACLVGLTVWAGIRYRDAQVFPSASESGETNDGITVVNMRDGSLTYACPPGVVDPTDQDAEVGDAEDWQNYSGKVTPLVGGGTSIEVAMSQVSEHLFSAFGFAGNPRGDFAAFLADSCILPAAVQYLPAGSTEIGEDTALVLANPYPKPVSVQVQVLSPKGALLELPQDVVVGAHSTAVVLPAIWAPGEPRVAFSVVADGYGIAAWVQSSGLDGEVPLGVGRLGGQKAAVETVITGIDPSAAQSLRIANPGGAPQTVEVEIYTERGPVVLGGITGLEVAAKGVFDIDIGALPRGTHTLRVRAQAPIVASVAETRVGNPFNEDPELSLSSRTLVGPGDGIVQAVVPSRADLEDLVRSVGFRLIQANVVLANPSDTDIVIEMGGKPVTLAAGNAVEVPVQDSSITSSALTSTTNLRSDSQFYGAMVLDVESLPGPIRSVIPLTEGSSELSRQLVKVLPSRGQ